MGDLLSVTLAQIHIVRTEDDVAKPIILFYINNLLTTFTAKGKFLIRYII